MNTTMKVSCIVPVYNTSRYVGKCVDSILSQTYNNIEIVLVNDCSTDKSAEVCRSYVSKYHDKIIFIDKPVNEGVDKARFTGLSYVSEHNKAGAVMFVDSDDYLSARSVELLVANMVETNADVVQMRANRVFGPIRRPFYSPMSPQLIEQPELFDDYFISFFGINILDVNMWSKLFRVETLAASELQPTGFKMGEDLMFNMKLFPYLKKYSIIDYRGYNYRVGGLTSRYNPTLWEDLKRQYHIKRDFAHQYNYTKAYHPLNVELKNIFLSSLCQRIIYLKESQDELRRWIKNELDDATLWADICEMSKTENEAIYSYIANKDIDSLIDEAQVRIHASRWRQRAKKILSLLFR